MRSTSPWTWPCGASVPLTSSVSSLSLRPSPTRYVKEKEEEEEELQPQPTYPPTHPPIHTKKKAHSSSFQSPPRSPPSSHQPTHPPTHPPTHLLQVFKNAADAVDSLVTALGKTSLSTVPEGEVEEKGEEEGGGNKIDPDYDAEIVKVCPTHPPTHPPTHFKKLCPCSSLPSTHCTPIHSIQ